MDQVALTGHPEAAAVGRHQQLRDTVEVGDEAFASVPDDEAGSVHGSIREPAVFYHADKVRSKEGAKRPRRRPVVQASASDGASSLGDDQHANG